MSDNPLQRRLCIKCGTTHQIKEKCPKWEREWTPQEKEKFKSNPWGFNSKRQERTDLRNQNAKQTRENKKYLLATSPFCAHCGDGTEPNKLHLDHIINIARGGGFELSNCQLLCAGCHQIKTDKEKSVKKRGRKEKDLRDKQSDWMKEKYE